MQTTRNRISKIEQRISPPSPGKLVVVRGGATDAEVTDLLKASGIDEANPAHTIVVLRTLFEDKSGALSPLQPKAEILSVTEKNA